jgi:hypothetical protein
LKINEALAVAPGVARGILITYEIIFPVDQGHPVAQDHPVAQSHPVAQGHPDA